MIIMFAELYITVKLAIILRLILQNDEKHGKMTALQRCEAMMLPGLIASLFLFKEEEDIH